MNYQVFPNWCKKLSFSLLCAILILIPLEGFSIISLDFVFAENTAFIFSLLGLISLFVLIMSKEKIEDDYIKLLRFESFQLSIFIVAFISFILFLFDSPFVCTPQFTISFVLILHEIIFTFKKK